MRSLVLASLLLVALPARAGSPPQPSLLDQVPDAALLGGAVRSGSLDWMRQWLKQTPDLQKDLGAFLTRRIGVDLTKLDGVAVWSTQLGPQPTFGAFLKLTPGTTPPIKGG